MKLLRFAQKQCYLQETENMILYQWVMKDTANGIKQYGSN